MDWPGTAICRSLDMDVFKHDSASVVTVQNAAVIRTRARHPMLMHSFLQDSKWRDSLLLSKVFAHEESDVKLLRPKQTAFSVLK